MASTSACHAEDTGSIPVACSNVALAQPGERLFDVQEVIGPTPISNTIWLLSLTGEHHPYKMDVSVQLW